MIDVRGLDDRDLALREFSFHRVYWKFNGTVEFSGIGANSVGQYSKFTLRCGCTLGNVFYKVREVIAGR